MSLIQVNNLSFSYEGTYEDVFREVSFNIDSDWKLGLISRNGRGKTTLLKLMSGRYDYQGSILSNLKVDYFPFDIKDVSMNTIDAVESIKGEIELWRLIKEMHQLELNEEMLYRPFKSLSMGERTKIMLAMLFIEDNNFLLIDEPTNHLDIEGRYVVSRYLNSKKGFILVSHDQNVLDNCIDHVLSINRSDITVTKGDFTTWEENKLRQDNYEIAQNDKLKKEIRRLETSAAQMSGWSDKIESTKIGTHSADRGYIGMLSAKMMRHSIAVQSRRQRAIEEKEKLLKNIEKADDLKIHSLDYHSRYLVRINNLSISYDGKNVFDNLSMDILQGERVALVGRNGCGKTSLIKLILGADISYTGEISVGSNLIISTVSQDTSYLKGDLKRFAIENKIDESLFKAILRKFGYSRSMFDKDISSYSEGQKKQVLLAKSLSQQAHIYIWDEPLNYIDILSRKQIENLIMEFCPTMLFVEHDTFFVNMVASKVVEIG
ncbi:MAG: ABC-F type ribosomal protection protein [Clostridia bacterium]|nr:ABC-F type ribosomal protection protein [Clostridia bacterium]